MFSISTPFVLQLLRYFLKIASSCSARSRSLLVHACLFSLISSTASATPPETQSNYGFLDTEALRACADSANDQPVAAINLYRFKSPEHAGAFWNGLTTSTVPFLAARGVSFLQAGSVVGEFARSAESDHAATWIANHHDRARGRHAPEQTWDAVAVVLYPSYATIVELLDNPVAGPFVLDLREENLDDARFFVTAFNNIDRVIDPDGDPQRNCDW